MTVSGDTLTITGHGLVTGDKVRYDSGAFGNLPGLTDGGDYFVIFVDANHVKLALSPQDTAAATIVLNPGVATGRAHRIVPATSAGIPGMDSKVFSPQDDVTGNIIKLPYTLVHDDGSSTSPLVTGDAVTYHTGGGAAIGGLEDGQTYYAIVGGSCSPGICLATSKDNALANTAIALDKNLATGEDHSIVLDGGVPQPNASDLLGLTTMTAATTPFRGLAVTATNRDRLATIGVSGGGGSVAVNVGGAVHVHTADTKAYIDESAQINQSGNVTASAQQSVRVAAGNDYSQLGVAGAIAISAGVSVAPGADIRVVTINTDAYIADGAAVTAKKDVRVEATATDKVISVAAGIAGGASVGVGGAVSVIVLNLHTWAYIGDASVHAGNNVLVSAADHTKTIMVAGSLGIGIAGAGIGMSVGVVVITKDTQAFIADDATVDAKATLGDSLTGIFTGAMTGDGDFVTTSSFHGLAVQAASSEDIFGVAVSGGGGFVGVAGGIGVEVVKSTTKAYIGDAAINTDRAGVGASQSVNVSATNAVDGFTLAGGLGAGFVGIGGAVDIGIIKNTTRAYIGADSEVHASEDIDVNALSSKDLVSVSISVGAGFVGVSGSVSVWTIGTEVTSEYDDGTEGSFQGNWSAGVTYTEGDIVKASDGRRYQVRDRTSAVDTTLGDDPVSSPDEWGAISDDTLQSDAPKWKTGESYAKNDQVVGSDGKRYQAKTANVSNAGNDPTVNASVWQEVPDSAQADADRSASGSNGSSGWTKIIDSLANSETDPASQKIAQRSATAKSSFTAQTGIASNAVSDTSIPEGTVAAIQDGADVTAGGSVGVRAAEQIDFFGFVGSFQGGFVAVGASVLVVNVDSNTDASIGSGALVQAGTGSGGCTTVGDCVTVAASYDEHVQGIGIAGSGGFVAVGAQVVVINSTADQTAHIDSGAALPQAGGGIEVSAGADRDVSALSLTVAGGAVAVGAAIGIVNADGDTIASVGNVAMGTDAGGGTVRGLTVAADADAAVTATAYAIQAGIAALNGAVAVATLEGKARAASGAHGPLGSGGLTVSAITGDGEVIADTLIVAIGGLAAGITIASAEDAHSTEAEVTSTGDVGTTGDVTVLADASNVAKATAPGVTVGAITLAAMLPSALVSGHTTAKLNGSVEASTGVTVQAVAENHAKASATLASVSIGGISGAFADAEVADTADIDAIVGSTSGIESSGIVLIEAKTKGAQSKAEATVQGASGGALLSGTIFGSSAISGGRVHAALEAPVGSSSQLTVRANGDHIALATTTALGLSGAVDFSASVTLARVTSGADVEAIVTAAGDVTSNGAIDVTADSTSTATATSDSAGGALVASVGITIPTAEVGGATLAQMNGDVDDGDSFVGRGDLAQRRERHLGRVQDRRTRHGRRLVGGCHGDVRGHDRGARGQRHDQDRRRRRRRARHLRQRRRRQGERNLRHARHRLHVHVPDGDRGRRDPLVLRRDAAGPGDGRHRADGALEDVQHGDRRREHHQHLAGRRDRRRVGEGRDHERGRQRGLGAHRRLGARVRGRDRRGDPVGSRRRRDGRLRRQRRPGEGPRSVRRDPRCRRVRVQRADRGLRAGRARRVGHALGVDHGHRGWRQRCGREHDEEGLRRARVLRFGDAGAGQQCGRRVGDRGDGFVDFGRCDRRDGGFDEYGGCDL